MSVASSICIKRTIAGAMIAMAVFGISDLAQAEKIGVAAAVNPDAFSSQGNGATSQLRIGKSIFFDERISTTGSGIVQVLLLDGSTFTVGPGSNLVIDKFVYDPRKQRGEIVASMSKGAMRFIGGKISKGREAVTLRTPAGLLGIRGGIFQGQVNGTSATFSFVYGVEMTFTGRNGRSYSVYEPGYTLDLSNGRPNIRPTTAADTSAIMSALTRNAGGASGSGSSNGSRHQIGSSAYQQANNDANAFDQLVSDATTTRIQDELAKQLESQEQASLQPMQAAGASQGNPPDLTNGDDNGDGAGGGASQLPNTDVIQQFVSDVTTTQIQGVLQNQSEIQEQVLVQLTQIVETVQDNLPDPGDDSPPEQPPVTQYKGYAAGLVVSDTPVEFNNVVATSSPDDFVLLTDEGFAEVNLHDIQDADSATSRYLFGFKYPDQQREMSASVFDADGVAYSETSAVGHLVDGDEAELTRLFPDTFGEVGENAPAPPLCSDCEFLKWGAFTTQVSFSNGAETTEYVDSIHGWWVAGDLTAPVEIDALAARQATATYSGHVVGTVVSLGNDQWQTYDAAGDLVVNWEFAPRAGDLTISNFDGRSFGTGEHGLTQPTASLNQFSGSLTQFSGPAISNFGGNAAGSFVRGPRSPAQGVIGNWNVGGNGYKATGIFAGSGIPKAGN